MAKYKCQYVSIYNEYNAARPPEKLEESIEKFYKEINAFINELNLNPREVRQYIEDSLTCCFAENIIDNGMKLWKEEKKMGVKK